MAKRGKVKLKRRKPVSRVAVKNYRSSRKTKPPISVKIISILTYVSAILSILFGLVMVVGSILGASLISYVGMQRLIDLVPGLTLAQSIIGPALLVLMFLGFIAIVVGVIEFLVGAGLWKGKKWAYVLAVVIVLLAFIKNLLLLFVSPAAGIAGVIIYGVIGYFLLFDKRTRNYFS
ncbi:MAG: hypothetical protein WC796_01680 [Candidatus Pacearchaeota archaeon]|jgi:hypothetical protein